MKFEHIQSTRECYYRLHCFSDELKFVTQSLKLYIFSFHSSFFSPWSDIFMHVPKTKSDDPLLCSNNDLTDRWSQDYRMAPHSDCSWGFSCPAVIGWAYRTMFTLSLLAQACAAVDRTTYEFFEVTVVQQVFIPAEWTRNSSQETNL